MSYMAEETSSDLLRRYSAWADFNFIIVNRRDNIFAVSECVGTTHFVEDWTLQIGTCASGKTTKTMESGPTKIGEEFSFTIGSRLGRSPEYVTSRGIPFSRAVWLWRSWLGADKWYSNLGFEDFMTLNFLGMSCDFVFLSPCDIGSSFEWDTRLAATFTVEFDKLISSNVRPPCRKRHVSVKYNELTKREHNAEAEFKREKKIAFVMNFLVNLSRSSRSS